MVGGEPYALIIARKFPFVKGILGIFSYFLNILASCTKLFPFFRDFVYSLDKKT